MLNSPPTSPIEPPRRVPAGLEDYEGARQFATPLARGLELLRCFTPEEPVLGTKDLAQRLGFNLASYL